MDHLDALYGAAIAGDAHAITELEMKADKLEEDESTILHTESIKGNTERVRFILRQLANKNLLAKLTRYKYTALHFAIYRGHTEVAEVLIKAARHLLSSPSANPVTSFQAFLRQGDMYGDTALHAAVMKGNVAIVKLLVEADPTDRHTPNDKDETPMYIAVEKGFNDIIEIISTICTAPSLNGPDSIVVRINNLDEVNSFGGTRYKIMKNKAIYEAAIAGDADFIAILERAADTLNNKGRTILHIESYFGNTERVRFILREFANKNLLVKLSKNKETALYMAAYQGHTEVVEVLIDSARHELLSSSSANDSTHDSSVTSFQDFLRQGDKDMDTALHAAVKRRRVDVVRQLVEADLAGDRHIQNNEGKTPIYIAAEKGYTDIVKVICTTCTAPLNMDGPGGTTALHVAIKNGKYDRKVVEILIAAARLLSSSSDDDSIDANDRPVTSFQAFLRRSGAEDLNTALHAAVMEGNVAIVKLLLKADPAGDRHIQNNEGKTPIYIAVEKRYTDIVKVICTTCTAPLNMDGPGGSTALHAAIKNGNHNIEVVEALIAAARLLSSASENTASDNDDDPVTSFQAFLRKGDEDLNSALHVAVIQGNLATAKLLVEADPSDPRIANKKGKTPFYTALERRDIDIVKMICTTCTGPFHLFGPDGGRTALHVVIKNLDEAKKEVSDVIKMIMNVIRCAFISEDKYDKCVDEYTIHRVCAEHLFRETDQYRETILELAVERNYVKVVELILDVHNPAYRDDWIGDEFVSLMPLIYKAEDKGYQNIVELLTKTYQAGAANLSIDLKNQASLISAIRRRQKETVFSLLDDDAKRLVTFVDNLGWTALHHAAYHEFDQILYAIVEAQKTFGHKFEYEDMVTTPFQVAAERGYTSTVILLMQMWPSSSSAYTNVDKHGQNILHLAALQSKKDMIQDILKHCPEEYKKEFVNKQDNNGNTPLHVLIWRGCLVPELLRYERLDIMVENNQKWTPADMLYFEDQIVDQQVQIKIALDNIQIDEKKDIFSSSVLSSKQDTKDAILFRKAKLMIHEKHTRMKEDSHAVSNCFADAIAGDAISKAALEMEADTLNKEGKTILHVESMRGDAARVRYIVREFAHKNLLIMPDGLNQTALHLATQHGHTQVVEILIDAAKHLPSSSANNDTQNPVGSSQDFIRQANGQMGNTALHLAVLNGNVAIVKLIVDADPNDSHVQNNEGKTPIYIAAENGYQDIVKEICKTCTALSLDGPGGRTTALHALIRNIGQATEGNRDAIRMIISAAKHSGTAEDSPHLSFEVLFERNDESGRTVLDLAVEKSNAHAVELILGQDPAYESGRGSRNHLMHLIYKAIDEQHGTDIVNLLSVAYETGIATVHKGVLTLILAIKRRNKVLALQLLQSNRKLVTFADDEGWTPLHYAAYHQFVSIFEVIIKALNDELVYSHSTPFHVAAENGHTYTMTQLMKLWPNSSSAYIATNKTGQNILHLAAARNQKKMIQDILVYCPQVHKKQLLEQKDPDGNTALHLLISNGCYIPELINHKGLDLMAINNENLTPRDMLYSEDEIIAHQVQIKIALDHVQTNEPWKFWKVWKLWRKGTEKETDIFESIVLPDRRETKDVLFNERNNELMDKKYAQIKTKLERYKDRTNTQIVVAALITTVTFTVGFTMPGGLHQTGEVDEGLVVLSKKRAFGAFMVTDALALLLSTSSLFFYFLQSIYEDPRQVARLNAASTGLNIVSVTAMMVTFITGTYVVLYNTPALAITVCIIGSLFFILVIVLLIKIVYDRGVKRNED